MISNLSKEELKKEYDKLVELEKKYPLSEYQEWYKDYLEGRLKEN
jgi:hypothetical protein